MPEKREHPDIMFAIGWYLGRAIGWTELLARRIARRMAS
jgi:hypothetical protein